MDELILRANAAGFSGAAVLPAREIVLARAFRDACAENRCGLYGKCYMCPPDIGDIDTLMEKIRGYDYGLLLQTISPLADSFDIEGMLAGAKRHAKRMRALWQDLRTELPEGALCLSGGGCRYCKVCAKVTSEPCRFPQEALSSLEAYGVSVAETVAKTPLHYINGQNTLTYFGMILF